MKPHIWLSTTDHIWFCFRDFIAGTGSTPLAAFIDWQEQIIRRNWLQIDRGFKQLEGKA